MVYGEVGDRRTREVTEHLERFREAIATILPGAGRAPVPTVVVVFKSQKSFGRFRPRYNGHPTEVGGFFSVAADQNLIALSLEQREFALRIIFHEYMHLVVADTVRGVPAWLAEGLADYYSTFAVSEDGRAATVGLHVPGYHEFLNHTPLLKLEELLKVDHTSPLYNEERRTIFYAQSWALVHMLVNQGRSRDLARYLAATEGGASAAGAWQLIFPDLDANAALAQYLTRRVFRAYKFRFSRPLTTLRVESVPVSPSEARAALGDVLRTVAPADEAETYVEHAAALQPSSVRATALLGQMRVVGGRDEDARKLLVRAAEGDDWFACYTAAAGLTRLLVSYRAGDYNAVVSGANRAVAVVLAARPDLPYALAMKAAIGSFTGTDLEPSLRAIRQARRQAPGREDFAFIEAEVLARRREFSAARSVVAPWMSPLNSPSVRERARALMVRLVEQEKSAQEPLLAIPHHIDFSGIVLPGQPAPVESTARLKVSTTARPATAELTFCCPAYLSLISKLITSHWHAEQPVSGRTQVRFTIARDGTLTDVLVEAGSEYAVLNVAAVLAVVGSNPLPPLPTAYTEDHLVVHLIFVSEKSP